MKRLRFVFRERPEQRKKAVEMIVNLKKSFPDMDLKVTDEVVRDLYRQLNPDWNKR